MSGSPKKRKDTGKGAMTHRAEARKFLGTHMQQAMIRGLGDDEERARIWLGIANKMHQNGELGSGIVANIAEKVTEAQE